MDKKREDEQQGTAEGDPCDAFSRRWRLAFSGVQQLHTFSSPTPRLKIAHSLKSRKNRKLVKKKTRTKTSHNKLQKPTTESVV